MHRCVLRILFVLSLIFEARSAFAYVPAMPKFDMLTKADGGEWWIPAGQYKVTDVKPAVRSSDRSAKERNASPPRVDTKLEKVRKIASEISRDAVEYAKSCIPEEVKGAGKFVFEYAKENSPQVIRQSFEFAADKLASVMSCLADFVEASETDVRRYLRDDLGLPQWVAQDIGSTVGIGGKCAIAFMPGKVLSETTKTIKLINVSFANGAGSGFKVALEQPLAKYKPVKFEKTKGTSSSKGGTGFEKEPKEPKLREVKIEKPNEVKPAKSERVVLEYGKGKFWDGLIKDRESAKTCGVSSKNVDEILGRIQRAKKQIGGDIRADNKGNLYKFDKLHKTGKVHLEKIEEHEGKFWGTGEVNPESGAMEPIKWRLYK